MKIELTIEFYYDLYDIIDFISRDKPRAARKFKSELVKNLKRDLANPFLIKKSIYFDDDSYRDYVFKGYTTVVKFDSDQEIVYVIGVLKYRKFIK